MNTPTKELAMYFGNIVNSRLEFLDDALNLGNLQAENERFMSVKNFQDSKNHTVGDLHNGVFAYKGVQNDVTGCSRNTQSNLGHQYYQPVAKDLSRHCERMFYQMQADIQPLDYSNNYRNINPLTRLNEYHSTISTNVTCNTKPLHSDFNIFRKQSSTCSTNSGRASLETHVNRLKQCALRNNNIENGSTVENISLDVIKRIQKHNMLCSNACNETVETFSSEENNVSNLKDMPVQLEQEKVVSETDQPSTELECRSNEDENNRIGKQIVNEILDSVEESLNTINVENLRKNLKKKLVPGDEKDSNNVMPIPDNTELASSLKSKPSKEKIKLFSCPECTWVFSSKPALAKHLGKKHKVKRSRKTKTDKKVNPDKTTFQCNKCKCSFSERNELKVHALIHLKEKRLKCNTCGLSFIRRRDLDYHSLLHNKKPACCEICGKTFSQAGNMKIHLRIHTKEKPYTCPHCGKSYAQSGDLKTHIRVHTDDRPYLCEYCGNLFLSLSHLARHSKVHTKEKPYTCQVCGNSFAHTHHLKKHYRIHTF